jgi:glycolate oxidase FAD binding subunit
MTVSEKTVLEPGDAKAVAEMLRSANGQRLPLLTRGGGTKLGAAERSAGMILSTKRLIAPVDHQAGDLVATIPAGRSLKEANEVLMRERQWLPLDPPYGDRATIGGIVAANDSGPRRHRHGAPRDLIIGIEMTLASGDSVKAGGRVVKNVAGYDLMRLLCGSFGSLAVITSATFKLAPLPQASRTLVAEVATTRVAGDLLTAISEAPVAPSAVELEAPLVRLLVRFEGTAHACDAQTQIVSRLLNQHGATGTVFQDDAESTVWRQHELSVFGERSDGDRAILKISVLPSNVTAVLDRVAQAPDGIEWRLTGRAGLGVVYVALSGHASQQVEAIARLRAAVAGLGGTATVAAAPATVSSHIDKWGDVGDAAPLMRLVKAQFDPNGILNPGGGPGGI